MTTRYVEQAIAPSVLLFDPSCQLEILCWACDSRLAPLYPESEADLTCPICAIHTPCYGGIFHALTPHSAEKFARFTKDYELVRAAEERGSLDPAYYLALPFADLTGKLSGQWKIRARTFQHTLDKIIKPLATRLGRPLDILDLGAGNSWLSYRLSLLGHRPVAVDLLTNDRDGLGAARHYAAHLPRMFPRVQADLSHLPFASASFDLAIFNASFHYSEDFAVTLSEALRCVRPGAPVVIADTPWYRHERSGLAMVAEKHAHFLKTYGFASDSLRSQEFLTPDRLSALARSLTIRWRVFKPWYGLDWAMRPLRAKLERRRAPSKFHIFVAERAQ
jgi:SAM-dependent methyltransferase